MRRLTSLATVLVLLATFGVLSNRASAQTTPEVVAVHRAVLPTHPRNDAAWGAAPARVIPLLPQNLVAPRLLEASTKEVRVQAMTDGERLAFRMIWVDGTKDDLPGSKRFSDACAVMVPVDATAPVPAPMMGEAGKPVEITYWSAFWQASVDGRPDTIKALFPGATVDHYPFEAPTLEVGSKAQRAMALRFAPARAMGNRRVGPRKPPVEDLIAEGPGTVTRAGSTASTGRGSRTEDGWVVQFTRPLPKGLKPGGGTVVQFAVWNGSQGEVGSRKMWSGWVPLRVAEGQ